MHEPYKMVLLNLTGLITLAIGVIIYRFVYPKKRINLFTLLILISILPIISILRPGAYESGDFNIHIYRVIEFYRSLSEGNIIPSWAMNLNATYGYPLFSFNYIIPYYFISLIHFFGFSFIASMKIFLITNFIFSGIFMFIFSKSFFKNNTSAFVSSIFYLFAPYHLISLHFKVTIGEILAFTLIPLFFLSLHKLYTQKERLYIVLTGFILGLIFLTHIYIAIMLIPLSFLFILIYSDSKKFYLVKLIYSIVISLTISFFQWFPSILYKDYLFTSINPVNINALYYPNLLDLLYAPWRYGFLFQGPMGELSYLIGYTQIFILISIIFLYFKNKIDKKHKKIVVLSLLIVFSIAILVNPISKELWNKIPVISSAGSHRLLILIIFFISVLSGYFAFVNKKNNKLIYIVVLLTIGTTVLNWGHRRVIPEINDKVLKENIPLSTAKGEAHFYANTKWVDKNSPWFSTKPTDNLEIEKGNGSYILLNKNSIRHEYKVSAETDLLIKENTLYFPGWKAKSNNNQIELNPNKNGVISFSLPKGVSNLELYYEDLPQFTISKIVSLFAFFLSLFYLIISFFKGKLSIFHRRK